jgi:Flp pilus assembly pilin Flp
MCNSSEQTNPHAINLIVERASKVFLKVASSGPDKGLGLGSGYITLRRGKNMIQALAYLKARMGSLRNDERGVVTVEYAVLLVGIVAVVGVAVLALQGVITTFIGSIKL